MKRVCRFAPVSVNTTGRARTETFHGREYFVAPAVMMTEGVHHGSAGPIYYNKKFLRKDPEAWDHKPIVVYHPSRGGEFVSAGDPEILNNSGVGFLLRTRYDEAKKGWKTECWFDKNQTKKVDPRVYQNLESGKVTEVSTGMFLRCAKKKGEWNGQRYRYEALRAKTNDHLAVLPDQKGACSVEKGAGLLVNSIRGETKGTKVSIYRVHNIYYKQAYTVKDGKVELIGSPEKVVRNVSYDPVDSNSEKEPKMATKTKKTFNRKKHIRRLIGNGFAEADRVWLEELEDDQLSKINPKATEDTDSDTDDDDDEANSKSVRQAFSRQARLKAKRRKAKLAANKDDKKMEEQPKVDLNTLIANADKKTLRALRNALGIDGDELRERKIAHQRAKAKLVQAIVANEANSFTEEELKAMEMKNLKRLAKLAANTMGGGWDRGEEEEPNGWGSLYIGQNTVRPTVNNSDDEEDRFLESTPMFNEKGDSEDDHDYDDKPSQKAGGKKKQKAGAR